MNTVDYAGFRPKGRMFTCWAAAIGVIVIGLAGCGVPPIGEEEFGEAVARHVTRNVMIDSAGAVVMEPSDLDALPQAVRQAILRHLRELDVDVVIMDLEGRVENLPGQWVEDGSLARNESYTWLSVAIRSESRKREVEWSYICGRRCGRGGSVELRWSRDGWKSGSVNQAVF